MLLLLVRPKGMDRIHDQRTLHRREGPDAALAPLQLLHDQPVSHVVEPGAAVLLGQVGAEEAQLGHAGDELLGELSFYIGLTDDRDEVLIHPGPHGIAHRALILGEEGIEIKEIDAGELRDRCPSCHLCLSLESWCWEEYNSG